MTTFTPRRSAYRTLIWAGLALWAVLAIIFAFTDEAISDALYNPHSGWADFLECYGQMPAAFLGAIGGSILLRLSRPSQGARQALASAGLLLLTVLMALAFMADATGLQAKADPNPGIVLGGTIAIVLLMQVALRFAGRERLENLRPASKVAVALPLIAGILTVWMIKVPWGRWTYRDILEAGDRLLFTPWYLPQGNNGHHSFISGHTAFSFSVLPIALFFSRSRTVFNTILTLALTWGLIGALSRVVVGAHFAADTLFAAGLTITWFVVLSRRFRAIPESPDSPRSADEHTEQQHQ